MRNRIQVAVTFFNIRINPSTLLIKGPIFKGNFSADVGRSVCVSITWDFVWGKGTIFKEIYWHGPFG